MTRQHRLIPSVVVVRLTMQTLYAGCGHCMAFADIGAFTRLDGR
jgi:hypothetical protein